MQVPIGWAVFDKKYIMGVYTRAMVFCGCVTMGVIGSKMQKLAGDMDLIPNGPRIAGE